MPETQSQLRPPSTTPAVKDEPPVGEGGLELSLGEFLSLTVEILRQSGIVAGQYGPQRDGDCVNSETLEVGVVSSETLLTECREIISDNLCTLTFVVNQCVTNSLYVLKRLFDIFLKLMPFTISCFSPPQPHTVTMSQATHPQIVTTSQAIHPHIVTTSQATHHHIVTTSQATPTSHPLTTKRKKSSGVINNIHECLNNLTQNTVLNSSFRFWMNEASIGMQDVPPQDDKFPTSTPQGVIQTPPEAGPSIETGLMYTVLRKALLTLLEFAAVIIAQPTNKGTKSISVTIDS